MSIIEYGKKVLRVEAEAVAALVARCGESFEQAVRLALDLIGDERGRFVISGMGKGGLVGAKISATLASTGTPSLFIHPAEAIHGDLGRFTRHDVVLLISNSGETAEIVRLVEVLKRIGPKTIAMTGKANSSLAEYSDIVLDIGDIAEACPLGLAPSATTTAMLALGDALALTVLNEREFGPEDYARFHPGGSLGRRLMKVHEVMRHGEQNVTVSKDVLVRKVLAEISRVRAGSAVVIDSARKVLGIFTDGDLRRHLEGGADFLDRPVHEVMTLNPTVVLADNLCGEAVKIMRDKKIDELPVVDAQDQLMGLLDIQDVLAVGLQ